MRSGLQNDHTVGVKGTHPVFNSGSVTSQPGDLEPPSLELPNKDKSTHPTALLGGLNDLISVKYLVQFLA